MGIFCFSYTMTLISYPILIFSCCSSYMDCDGMMELEQIMT